jgi:shikimate 5-dehydrogenase
VTSPLKLRAFHAVDHRTEICESLQSVNTLKFINGQWSGHNTDFEGLSALLKSPPPEKVVVWGGGGVLPLLQRLCPKARFVKARQGSRIEKGSAVVWAVPPYEKDRLKSLQWPYPLEAVERVIDLNYSDNSPGRELARAANCAYESGKEMFLEQARHQQLFWKDLD